MWSEPDGVEVLRCSGEGEQDLGTDIFDEDYEEKGELAIDN